jgi:serine phosphatase RsbU (regulator of sigma subunit)/PAS domain-containing protein
VASSGEDVPRLAAVIDRQRRELDQLRREAAARSVLDMAKGALIERLGCSPSEATGQLAALAEEAGTPVAEIAAAIIGHDQVLSAGAEPVRLRLAEAATEQATNGAELAAAVLDQALAPLGAAAVVLWLLGADGSLGLLGEAGLGPAEASRWRRVPPQMDSPAQRVAQGGPDLWWPRGRPAGDAVPLAGRWPDGARTAVALRDRGGALHGVMEVCWPEPLDGFADGVRQQVGALAEACAQVLSTRLTQGELTLIRSRPGVRGLLDGLLEMVLVASAVRDADGEVTDFRIDHVSENFRDPASRTAGELIGRTLLEAYPAAATAGVLDLAVRAFATGQAQSLTGPVASAPAGEVTGAVADIRIARFFDGVVITWRAANRADRLTALLENIERLGRIGGWVENLVTGEADWTEPALALFGLPARSGTAIPLADLHSYVIGADVPAVRKFRDTLLRAKAPTGATFRIVRADDGSVRQLRMFAEPVTDPGGQVVAVRGAVQDISAEYQTRVALDATRDQLADSEQRVAEEHLLAVRLQQAIMPPTAQPVEAAGIEVAVRYRPAAPGHLVGGDWYDTLLLPSKEVLLVVGDIAGHGIDAVTGVVSARYCLRGLAITGAGPAELLAYLNSALCHLTGGVVGTVVCGLYNPAQRVLRWARAGHLPPVLARDGSAAALPLPRGVLLGTAPDATYEEVTETLHIGDTVLLFTDGLIERREVTIDEAIADVARSAAQPEQSAAGLADHILGAAASDTGDDACLVAVRIHLPGPARVPQRPES